MTDRAKFQHWLAVEESKTVRFSELAHKIAKALHPSDAELNDYGAARLNLDAELKEAVRIGVLTVRNPAGLGVHTFPHGESLARAVLIPQIDLAPFLNARGIGLKLTPHGSGPAYWNLENAALELQKQLNWHDGACGTFLDQMTEAASSGALVVLDPHTCIPTRPNLVRTDWDLVTTQGVNRWLTEINAPYRWELQTDHDGSIPDEFHRLTVDGTPMIDGVAHQRYLEQKVIRNAKGLYTIREAAEVLAEAHDLNAESFIKSRMIPAFCDGALTVIDPNDGGPLSGRKCNDFTDLVTPEGVDAWLEAAGFLAHVRWPIGVKQEPNGSSAPNIAPVIATTEPDPLPTKTIAELFADIEYPAERWMKNIGAAKWLNGARRGLGERGGASATWCPLTIAKLIHERYKSNTTYESREKQKTLNKLNARFKTNPVLAPWKDGWGVYYEMFSDANE